MRRSFPILAHASLANAVTTLGALFGVVGVFFAARGETAAAISCCALALPCDVLDGIVARRTGSSSAFGAQLDTLADAISFCILPAALALALDVGTWMLLPAAFFAITGVLRLARFGVVGTSGSAGEERFEGLPTAVAAGYFLAVCAAAAWLPSGARAALVGGAYVGLGVAMVSAIPFLKRGLVARSLYAVVPISAALAWMHGR